jgi:hypothetical protein
MIRHMNPGGRSRFADRRARRVKCFRTSALLELHNSSFIIVTLATFLGRFWDGKNVQNPSVSPTLLRCYAFSPGTPPAVTGPYLGLLASWRDCDQHSST